MFNRYDEGGRVSLSSSSTSPLIIIIIIDLTFIIHNSSCITSTVTIYHSYSLISAYMSPYHVSVDRVGCLPAKEGHVWFNFFYASKIYALFTEVELYIVTVHVIHDDKDDKDEVNDDDDDHGGTPVAMMFDVYRVTWLSSTSTSQDIHTYVSCLVMSYPSHIYNMISYHIISL